MANDKQTPSCSSFLKDLENFNEQAPSSIEPQEELSLWSPPPATFEEESFGVLAPIDEWASKLLDPPSSELQEIRQVTRKLEQCVEQLQQ
jgi:hypothetical protein